MFCGLGGTSSDPVWCPVMRPLVDVCAGVGFSPPVGSGIGRSVFSVCVVGKVFLLFLLHLVVLSLYMFVVIVHSCLGSLAPVFCDPCNVPLYFI